VFTHPYPSWEAACREQSPDVSEQLDRKSATALQLRDAYAAQGAAPIAAKRTMSWPVTATLMAAAARRGGRLAVLDFGGAFGEYFHQNAEFLKHLESVQWHVVEQPDLVERARRGHATAALHFHTELADALRAVTPDVVLLSSVLQYLPDPYGLLAELAAQKASFIAIDRTLLGTSLPDVVGVQVVPANAYNPPLSRDLKLAMRFVNAMRMHQALTAHYRLIDEFPSAFDSAGDRPNEYVFRGFIYERLGEFSGD
jgi:putative methyltransferase (TIGR04325 family)